MDRDQLEVVDTQLKTQDRWTVFQNLTARFRHTAVPTRKIVHELLAHGVRRNKKQQVFEFGFGHGNLLFWFKPPTQIYGVELSPLALKSAIKRAKLTRYPMFAFTEPLRNDTVAIDYPDDFFDLVLSSHSLEHVYDDQRLIYEFGRVLKLGGILLLCVPHDAEHENLMNSVEERKKPNFPKKTYHVWQYNVETLKSLIMKANFEVLRAERFDAITNQRRDWWRPLQIAHILVLSMAPFSLWNRLDVRAKEKGYAGTQVLIVCQKGINKFY